MILNGKKLTKREEEIFSSGYGRGVTAGKKEALHYTSDEALNYVKAAARAEGFEFAKDLFKKPIK